MPVLLGLVVLHAGGALGVVVLSAFTSVPRRIAVPVDALRDKVKGLMPQARRDLAEMVAFKSVHDPAQFPPEECAGMVDWLLGAFSAVGLQDVRGYETPDGSKAVCGHAPGRPAPRPSCCTSTTTCSPRWTPRRGPRPCGS